MNRRLQFVLTCALLLLTSRIGTAQMIVAHRGASYDAPENTLAAFREAWAQEADGIEGDFYFTTDDKIVCIHDKDTAKTGGALLQVSHSTLEQLRELEYGSWKDEKFRGEAIPTLAEVMATVPKGKTFVIELKTGPEIVPLLEAELRSSRETWERLLIIAFDEDTVAACKQQMPEIRAHWLTGFKQDDSTHRWSPTAQQIGESVKRCGADGVGMQAERVVVDAQFVDQLKRNGVPEFHVWTVDAPKDAAYFQQLGAMGITTNRPALIRRKLRPAR